MAQDSTRPMHGVRVGRPGQRGPTIAGLLAGALLLLPAVAQAELQRVEAVGIYGIRDAMRSKVIPRDEAIAKARWEGVSRVALELVSENAPSEIEGEAGSNGGPSGSEPSLSGSAEGGEPSEDQVAALRAALGNDVLPYTRSYRILEDRGEVPVLFNDEPDVAVEYVVVVEVIVDVDRLTSALGDAGLIVVAESPGQGEAVIVELVGLSRYEAYAAVLETLRDRFGATRIQSIEFSPERQVLAVEGPFGAEALMTRISRFEHPQLVLEPLAIDSAAGRIRVMGRWFAGSDAESAPTS